MPNLVVRALWPTPTGATLLAAVFLAFRTQLQRTSWSKLALLFLLFLNRGALPLRWHFKLFWIALKARLRWNIARLGLAKPTPEQQKAGVTGNALGLRGVGKDVFAVVSSRVSRVSFAEADYNLHLSNSNYAQAGDFARMQFWTNYVGITYTHDAIMTLLGGTTFMYLQEIPMFAKYSMETRVVANDDKWCYALTRYIVPYDKRSKRPPAKSQATGKDCTICAFLLSRLCFKRGRVNVSPEKAYALGGMVGPADAESDPLRNWKLAAKLRKTKGQKAWIQKEDDAGQYIRGDEELNSRALAIIARLHDADRKVWLELDSLRE